MSVPEAPGTAFDTLIVEPAASIEPAPGSKPAEPALAEPALAESAPTEPVTAELKIRNRFTELDGLRGVAALLVVVFHLRKYVRDLDPPRQLDQLLSGGFLMVDLFFVLSGFVLARSMLATRTSADVTRFSTLRARRFLPLHLTGMAIAFSCVAVIWVAQHYGYQYAPEREAFSIPSESPWGYLSAALLLQGLIGPHYAGYTAAWSLSIELWTNILLVAAIALVPWTDRKKWIGPLATVLGLMVLFIAGPQGDDSIGWSAFGRGLTGLGLGMTVYWLYTAGFRRGIGNASGSHRLAGQGHRESAATKAAGTVQDRAVGGYRPARWPAIGAVLGLIALMVTVYYSKQLIPLRYVPTLAVAAGLIFCLVQPSDGPAHRLLNSPVSQWLGSRSFALYALHAPVLLAVTLAARLYGFHLHQPKVAIAILITTMICALAAAEFGHRFIERLWVPKKSG